MISNLRYVPDAALDHVRIIAITDGTDFSALAMREALPPPMPGDVQSVRPIHGRLLQKLAGAGAKVVVCDLFFRAQSQFDQALLEGVERLRAQNTGVVVAVPSWGLDPHGLPILSPTLRQRVHWGSATGNVAGRAPWSVHLLLQQGPLQPLPSLVLAAVANAEQANVAWSAVFGLQEVHLRYGSNPSRTYVIPLSNSEDVEEAVPEVGIQRDDHIGHVIVQLPSDAALRHSILECGDVLPATPHQLREWFAGKIVLVGDMRTGRDGPFEYPDGRSFPGCLLHAAAIDQILTGRVIRRTVPLQIGNLYFESAYVVRAGAFILGTLIGIVMVMRRRWGLLLAAAICVLTLAVYSVLFRARGVLMCPLVPLLVFAGVGISVMVVDRMRRPEL